MEAWPAFAKISLLQRSFFIAKVHVGFIWTSKSKGCFNRATLMFADLSKTFCKMMCGKCDNIRVPMFVPHEDFYQNKVILINYLTFFLVFESFLRLSGKTCEDAAPKVKCPTFILHGQADEARPWQVGCYVV